MNGSEETSGKFSAQVMIVILIALVTWVLIYAPRQKRQLEATALGKTVERGRQTEFNPVNQITVPTNVVLLGEVNAITRRGSAKGLKNVPMDATRRKRSCTCCVQRNGQ